MRQGVRKPIVGILLAAGRGSRFGGNKLLVPLPDGPPVAVAAVRNLRPACDRLIAVVRPENEGLGEVLGAEGCEVVICHAADAGMGYSLAAGVLASGDAFAWLVALADMPFIDPTSHQIVAARLSTGSSLVVTEYRGRRGHPVGFAACWFELLSTLSGDRGGKAILAAHPDALCACPVDDAGVLRDIDRPEDIV